MNVRRFVPLLLALATGCAAPSVATRPTAERPPVPAPPTVTIPDSAATFPLSATNPGPNGFPGGRGADQVVAYDTRYGTSTGTNSYGVEAVVRGGRVESLGGNDRPIPADGIVLSGHGAGKSWLLGHAVVGARIELTNGTIRAWRDGLTGLTALAVELPRLRQAAAGRVDLTARIDSLATAVDDLRATGSATDAQSSQLDRIATELAFRAAPSPSVEARGVWHRPTETTPEAIRTTLDRLQRAGFNLLFLESVWGGHAIYPSTLLPQNPTFKGFDPLTVWVAEARSRGIALHAWTHTFMIGLEHGSDAAPVSPLAAAHPDWLNRRRDGSAPVVVEPGYLFLDPGHPAVQDHLAAMYAELIRRYPTLAGVQLDYIRYPVSPSLDQDYGYSDTARQRFQKLAGFDPLTVSPADSVRWARWVGWRQDQVSNFVRRIHRAHPKTTLSAAVFPDLHEAKVKKYQDWPTWLKAGDLDFICPMSYTTDAPWIAARTAEMADFAAPRPVFVGLLLDRQLPPRLMLDEIAAARTRGSGVVFFALHSLTDELADLLRVGPFRTPATVR